MSGIEFGSGWYERLLIFRKNPKLFLDSRKISKESFCLDALKDLYVDSIGVQYKIHLLLLLQEHTSFLLTDADLAEQTVCTLQNLYHMLKNSEEKKLLKSQILFTLTTVLLSFDNLDHCFSKLLNDTKKILLSAALTVHKDHLLASTSCQCLEEIEEYFPGILMDDVEILWTFCQNCTSPSFQSYAMLLSSCLRHISELKQKNNMKSQDSTSTGVEPSSPADNEVPILSIFAYLLDVLPLMTQACVYMVLRNLTVVVKYSPELQSMVFKPWISRLVVSSDILYFHLAFDLLNAFGEVLFTNQEEQMLLFQLVSCAIHPAMKSTYRLLFLDWLGSFISKRDIFSSNSSRSSTDALFPVPFDRYLEQQQKLKLLAHYVAPKKKTCKYVHFLMNALSGLKHKALLPTELGASTSLFRVLYLYCTLNNTQSLWFEVKKLILFMVTTSPHLASHCMNFLRCIKTDFIDRSPESTDSKKSCEEIVSKLVDHVISLPVKQFLHHVHDYFTILEAAAAEDSTLCKPKTLLSCLHNLISQTDVLEKDVWMSGNSVLSICHSILKFQDIQLFCNELCELLLLVMKDTHDIDVMLRAKMYYSTIAVLSETKVKALFQSETYSRTTDDSLSSFLVGGEHTLHFRNTIQRLQKPVLKLTRPDKKILAPVYNTMNAKPSDFDNGIFKLYKDYVSSESFQPVVQVPFFLAHVDECDAEFSTLYGVVIKVTSSPVPSKAQDIEIPLMQQSKANETASRLDGILVILKFTPSHPYPVTLHFNAEFTSSSGCSYASDLPSVTLEFEDLFLLVPRPSILFPLQSQLSLFDEMWDYFHLEAHRGVDLSSSCSAGLQLDMDIKDLEEFVTRNWKPFLFSRPPESADFCIAVFLPPSCHLLMKINLINNAPFIRMITDDWTVLPWATAYLKKLKPNLEVSYSDDVSQQ